MNLASYIYSFLQKGKNQVQIPDFGIFHLQKTPARVDKEASKILPPSETILFEANADSSDKQLAEFIAQKTNKSIEQIEQYIQTEIKKWNEELSSNKVLTLENLGSFLLEESSTLTFTQQETKNSIDYFGLEEIDIKRIGNPKKGYNKIFFWVFIIALLLAALGFLGFYYQDLIQKEFSHFF